MSFNFFSLQFHVYGLILGLSIWLGVWLAEINARAKHLDLDILRSAYWWALIGGVLGARAWHVMTDWQLYVDVPWSALAIWQGGLSVLGGVLGGVVGLYLFCLKKSTQDTAHVGASRKNFKNINISNSNYYCENNSFHNLSVSSILNKFLCKTHLSSNNLFLGLLDLAALSLPISQAIGRLGNFFNQELYGWPTSLPWAVTIDPAHRFSGWQEFATYHPLFAYEMIFLILLWLVLIWFDKRATNFGETLFQVKKNLRSSNLVPIGSTFLLYIFLYSWGRFGLDFLRIDRPAVFVGLGFNQIVLLATGSVSCLFLRYNLLSTTRKS